eukprot:5512390-Prorocentrum_lima.AAC.1
MTVLDRAETPPTSGTNREERTRVVHIADWYDTIRRRWLARVILLPEDDRRRCSVFTGGL